ncbi:hypothetical protein BDB01DRAFT_839234 [Pilobolus umbonatus]|nr:hypothetical protein BDB01DRAFT_839234 [Pilobolus umbonatus]
MDHLPFEILESVILQLTLNDLLTCLTINSTWYRLFISTVYHAIDLDKNHKMILLLNSLTTNPRGMEAGGYVRYMSLNQTSRDNALKRAALEVDAIDALTYCPNLEHLIIETDSRTTEAPIQPRMPQLRNIKLLNLNSFACRDDFKDDIMACYYKYRSTLTTLAPLVSPTHTPDSLISYLSAFTALTELYIDLSSDTYTHSPMLDRILTKCSSLTRIAFKCALLNSPDSQLVIPNYALINDLTLSVKDLYLRDIEYMKENMKALKKLNLTVNAEIHDGERAMELISKMKSINSIKIKIRDSYCIDTYNTFWRYADLNTSLLPELCKKKSVIWLKVASASSMKLTISRCDTETTAITSTVCIPRNMILNYTEYLERISHCLHTLKIKTALYDSTVNFDIINRTCPALSKLVLRSPNLNESGEFLVRNNNLKQLTLCNARVGSAEFKEIELAFPHLEELKLIAVNLKFNHTIDNVYSFELPQTGLRSFTIEKDIFFASKLSIVVIKEIQGVLICAWRYCYDSKEMVFTQQENIWDVIERYSNNALFLFRSSTVEDVDIVINKFSISVPRI